MTGIHQIEAEVSLPANRPRMGRRPSSIDLAPIADPNHDDCDLRIDDLAYQSVISDAAFPELAQRAPFERLAEIARIF